MSGQFLGLSEFKSLILAGHARLRDSVGVVNALNVFPVPDGDTGTNMEMSLATGVEYLQKAPVVDIPRAVQEFVTGLMMGARGNSGVILSQLFRGFSKLGANVQQIDVPAFAAALNEGVQIAYRAVAKPVEGTILSVARESAQTGMREARKHRELRDWFELVVESAQRALEKTPQQLEVLKQAGVVDSGGQGLVFIYEGFLSYLSGEEVPTAAPQAQTGGATPQLDYAGAHIEHEGQYGYCTEVLVRLDGQPTSRAEQTLRTKLGEYGDSLLVVSSGDFVRAHVHTLHPGRVLEDALKLGPLLKIKIENMTEQHDQIRQDLPNQEVVNSEGQGTGASGTPHPPHKSLAIVAVAAGEGLRETLMSLGVDVILEGGQTMNPSTEDIVTAVKSANADECILLPNNKNIWLAAEQAKSLLGSALHLVKTDTIPQGIGAMVAYHPARSVSENVLKMRTASQAVNSGQVVRAVRNSTFQGKAIIEGQYLGMMNNSLVEVGVERMETALAVIDALVKEKDDMEIVTLFYGADVPEEEIQELQQAVEDRFNLDFEAKFGGQPVYDYVFSVE